MSKPAAALVLLLLIQPVTAGADSLQGDAAFSMGDYATAYKAWRALAEAGDASAMLGVGTLHDTGHGVPQDFAAALSWYRRAAEAGSVPAAFNVGAMYDNGRGTAVDRRQAVAWYRAAAAKGYGRAAYDLGVIYRDGDGVPPDRAEAIRYFGMAARDGIAAARPSLAALGAPLPPAAPRPRPSGGMSADRAAIAPPELRPIARFQEAALARADLDPSVARDFTAYVPTLIDEAGRGNQLAQYDVGFAYQRGLGLPADPVEAYVYYVRAAASDAADVRSAALKGAAEVGSQLSAQEHAAAREMLLGGTP